MDLDQPQRTSTTPGNGASISLQMDRRNRLAFSFSYLLIFFAAPVIYVGIVQAALCDKLGASATVSNMPASAYLLGGIAPVFLTWLVPTLAVPAGSLAPTLYGRITDVYGFSASFVLGIVVALLSLILVLSLPAGPALDMKLK